MEVRCWSGDDWPEVEPEYEDHIWIVGFALGNRAHLAPHVCHTLVQFVYLKSRPRPDTNGRTSLASALGVLAHETQHVAGTRNEAVTECYALQRIRPLARMLGASKMYAAGLAVYTWTNLYAYNDPAYKSRACRNGGSLDLNRNASAWP